MDLCFSLSMTQKNFLVAYLFNVSDVKLKKSDAHMIRNISVVHLFNSCML